MSTDFDDFGWQDEEGPEPICFDCSDTGWRYEQPCSTCNRFGRWGTPQPRPARRAAADEEPF